MKITKQHPIVLLASLLLSLFAFGPISASLAQTCDSLPPPSNLVSWWPLDGHSEDIQAGNAGILEGVVVRAKVGRGFLSGGTTSLVAVLDSWVKIDALNFKNMLVVWKGNAFGHDLSTPYSLLVGGASLSDAAATQIMIANTALPIGISTTLRSRPTAH